MEGVYGGVPSLAISHGGPKEKTMPLLGFHGPVYRTLSEKEKSKTVRTQLKFETSGPEGSDCGVFFDGYITITPFQFDWPAWGALIDMKTWHLKVR